MYQHDKHYFTAGTPISDAKNALVMIHGRGGSSADIASLAKEFVLKDTAIFAPQATHNSWYPHSFLAPEIQNQPALNSAIATIGAVVDDITAAGIATENIYFMGFSQGACLTLEYVGRNAQKYGGIVAFTGGLIGEQLTKANYRGNFDGTPILITTGDPDAHVPLPRVEASVELLTLLGANITLKVFKGRPHTIIQQEIELAQQLIFNKIPV